MSAPTYPATADGLRAALDALGTTAEAVAATLEAGGWRGKRDDCETCPTAKYLQAVIQGFTQIYVDRSEVSLWLQANDTDDEPDVQVETPPAVNGFIGGFDDGEFPELHADDRVDAS